MADCMLVTCAYVPELDPDDRLVMRELQKRGLEVEIVMWSDRDVPWQRSSLAIVRSTWDYHERSREFIEWVDRAAASTRLLNEPHLLRWNADKTYLRDLEARGVPVVPTAWIAQGEGGNLGVIAHERGWRDVVLKPARGAAGHGVSLVRRNEASLATTQARLEQLTRPHGVLVQPYLRDVETYGERALIFIAGRYSHAVVKKPFDTVLAVSDAPSSLVMATSQEIEVARGALDAAAGETLYARVDLLRDDDGNARVSELELIEPALYFAVYPAASAAFADAVVRELAKGRT